MKFFNNLLITTAFTMCVMSGAVGQPVSEITEVDVVPESAGAMTEGKAPSGHKHHHHGKHRHGHKHHTHGDRLKAVNVMGGLKGLKVLELKDKVQVEITFSTSQVTGFE